MPNERTKLNLPVKVDMSTPTLSIRDYPHLLALSKQIESTYSSLTGSHKDVYDARRKLNRLSRNLNGLRLKYRRVYEKPYQSFKDNVNALREHIKAAADVLSKQLDADHEERIRDLKLRLKPTVHEICSTRGIKDIAIPKECLKLSMPKKERIQMLADSADAEAEQERIQRSKAVGDKMVDPETGEVTGEAVARTFKFHDSKAKYDALVKFIRDNHIHFDD